MLILAFEVIVHIIFFCTILSFLAYSASPIAWFWDSKNFLLQEIHSEGTNSPEFNVLLSVPNNPDHQGICRAIFQILPHKKKKLFPFLQFLHPTIIFIFYTEKSGFLMSETKKSTLQLFRGRNLNSYIIFFKGYTVQSHQMATLCHTKKVSRYLFQSLNLKKNLHL